MDVAVDSDECVIHVRVLESFLLVGTLKSLNRVLVWCCVWCVDVAVDSDEIAIHVRALESFLLVGTLKSFNSVLVLCCV